MLKSTLACLAASLLLTACAAGTPLGEAPRVEGSAAASAPSRISNLEYRVGPEDQLRISVWQESELDREVLVRPDGGISFPLVGDLQVSGLTPLEIQDQIRASLRRVIADPVVTVAVDKISGYTVFVLGEVMKPDQFTLGRYVNVVQAITLAGGFSAYANTRDIQIIRRQNGSEVTFNFDFRAVSRGENLQQNILLQSGDVVLVP